MIKYGDFEEWITRNVKESRIIGGNTKRVYEIGPSGTIEGSEAYHNRGGSWWATSNVVAKVSGITKTSNAVYPCKRGSGYCAKLTSVLESCKAIGIINIEVMVSGSIFLGEMIEPIRGTSNPYGNMSMGVAFTGRPKALCFDYCLEIPDTDERVYSSGLSRKKHYKGHDKSEVFILLQRRWEDEDGNLYAARVGTGREVYGKSTGGWVNGHRIEIVYGDASGVTGGKGLIPTESSYYGYNSKGKLVPIHEVKWDSADATPTHMILMMSAGSSEPYTGTPGLTLYIDNVGLVY